MSLILLLILFIKLLLFIIYFINFITSFGLILLQKITARALRNIQGTLDKLAHAVGLALS